MKDAFLEPIPLPTDFPLALKLQRPLRSSVAVARNFRKFIIVVKLSLC